MSTPALWELAQQHRALAAQLDQLDLDEQTIADTLEGELAPIEQKAQACIVVAQTLAGQAGLFAARAKELAEHAKRLDARADWLRRYVRDAMLACGITEIAGPDWKAKLRQNPPKVVIDAESQIPVEFWREKIIREPDKEQIKAVLMAGPEADLGGVGKAAHLERGWSLVVK